MVNKKPTEKQLKQVLGQDAVVTFNIPDEEDTIVGTIQVRTSPSRYPDTIKELLVKIKASNLTLHISKTPDALHVPNLKNADGKGLTPIKKPGDRLENVVVYLTNAAGKAVMLNTVSKEDKATLLGILKAMAQEFPSLAKDPQQKLPVVDPNVLASWMKDIQGTDGKRGMVEKALRCLQANDQLLQPISPAKASASPRQ